MATTDFWCLDLSYTLEGTNTMKKRITFRGPALTQSGYGVHSRQVLDWLFSRDDIELNIQALPWGVTPWYIDGLKRPTSDLINKITTASRPPGGPIDVSYQLQLPHEWDSGLAKINIGMTAGVEADRCPQEWVAACNRMHAVIVPSEHTKASLLSTGHITTPIYVVKESYEDVNPVHLEALDRLDTGFNFLLFAQMTHPDPVADRKYVAGAIKAFCKAFKDNPDVGLVAKINIGKHTPIDEASLLANIKSAVSTYRSGQFPKVHLLHGYMNSGEIAGLYRHPSIKALYAPTRGEGFGLPILEAAVNDLPVMTTAWSAPTEYLKERRYIPLDYRLQQIPDSRVDGKIWVAGSRWAEPKEADIIEKLRRFHSMPVKPKEWALELGSTLRESHSQRVVREQYNIVSKEIEGLCGIRCLQSLLCHS